MKRSVIILSSILFIAGFATIATAQEDTAAWRDAVWEQKTPVQINREAARTQTISYSSHELARNKNYAESTWYQPMLEEWKKSGSRQVTKFSNTFKMPFSWIDRQLILYVGWADAPYEIVVNGKNVGYNQSSRTAAEFNITSAAQEGLNTLEIVIHDNAAARILNNAEKAGTQLLGDVHVVAQPRVRVLDLATRTTLEGKDAIIELGVLLKTELLNPKTMLMHYTLYAPSGEEILTGRREREIEMKREDTVRFILNVRNVKLWSPEEPNLYNLVLRSQNENRDWEYVSYDIGIRTVGINKGRLYVNGHSFPLSTAEYGAQDSREATKTGLEKLKSEGINFILVGRPQPEWFYTLCDKAGLFVCNQADINTSQSGDSRQLGGNPTNDPAWLDSYKDRVVSMMGNSFNHPSVIAYSLGGRSSNGYNLYESYIAARAKLSETGDMRPVIYLDAGGEWNTDAVSPETARSIPEAVDGRIVFAKSDIKVYSEIPVTFGEQDPGTGTFTVTNNCYFRELNIHVDYVVRQGRKKVSEGTLNVSVDAQTTVTITVPYGKAAHGKMLDVELSVNVPEYDPSQIRAVKKNFSASY